MSVGVLERRATESAPEPTKGGVAARRAMLRWSWRLFRREWRQQFLILLLIIVAVAAVVVGSAVAVNTPPAADAGFGTAHDLATFNLTPTSKSAPTSLPTVEAHIARIEHAVGTVQVIAERDVHRSRLHADLPAAVPGSPRPLWRSDAAVVVRPLPNRARTRSPSPRAWRPSSTCTWATRGPRAARPSSASCRTPRACSTSSRSSRRAR